jgi:drug/metabolite transporter (DMT)-like permease
MIGFAMLALILLLTASGQLAFKQFHRVGQRAWLAAAVIQFVLVVPLSLLAVQRFGIALVYILMSLSYALVALGGWHLFGEPVGRRQAAGIAVIVAGCIIFNF